MSVFVTLEKEQWVVAFVVTHQSWTFHISLVDNLQVTVILVCAQMLTNVSYEHVFASRICVTAS